MRGTFPVVAGQREERDAAARVWDRSRRIFPFGFPGMRPLPVPRSSFFFQFGCGASLLFVLGLVVSGCSGGGSSIVDEGDLAEQYLPTERTLEHHPDSVEALTIESDGDQLEYESDRDYESLWRKWSATYQNVGAGRSVQQPLSYATFWGLELTLASLQAEGTFALTEDQAQNIINQRRADYRRTIRIDVVWFASEGNTELTGPSAHVRLDVQGEQYEPTQEDRSPLREAFLDAGRTGVYRRNTFYFDRVVDGDDLLADATSIALKIRPSGARDRIDFRWTWETD